MSTTDDPADTQSQNSSKNNEEINILSFNSYITSIKYLTIITGVYYWAYFGFSISWIYAIAIVFTFQQNPNKEKKKKTKWGLARRMALGHEKKIILKLNHIPSWVTFPDVERAEWLNQIIKYLWPQVNEYMETWIRQNIEPFLPASTEFHKIQIGKVPLRIDGIKVFPISDTTRKTIILDIDLIYAGDCHITCDFYGVKGGVSSFNMHGQLRLVLEPLIATLPLIGGVKAYFLRKPEIDFSLASVSQLMTPFKDTIRGIVEDSISAMMVFPNIYHYQLVEHEEVAHTVTWRTVGVLRLLVVSAKDLVAKDMNGKSDPYGMVTLGNQEYRTRTIDKDLNPVWNEWFEFEVQVDTKLTVALKDHDDVTKDEKLGIVDIDIKNLNKNKAHNNWYTLKNVKHGQINLEIRWMSLSSNFHDLKETRKENEESNCTLSNALLFLHIDSAENLLNSERKEPDSYVVIQVGSKNAQTEHIKGKSDPVWTEQFTFLLSNPDSDLIKMTVYDRKTKEAIGDLEEPLWNYRKHRNMEMKLKSFQLQKAKNANATLTFSLRLAILKFGRLGKNPDPVTQLEEEQVQPNDLNQDDQNKAVVSENKPEEFLDENITIKDLQKINPPIGPGLKVTISYKPQTEKLVIIIHEMINLLDCADTYVKIYLQPGKIKRKTTVRKQSSSPVFDEKFEYEIPSLELLTCSLDFNCLTEKKAFNRGNYSFGACSINVSAYNGFIKPTTIWLDLNQL